MHNVSYKGRELSEGVRKKESKRSWNPSLVPRCQSVGGKREDELQEETRNVSEPRAWHAHVEEAGGHQAGRVLLRGEIKGKQPAPYLAALRNYGMFLSWGGRGLIGEYCLDPVCQVGGDREERLDTIHINVPLGTFNRDLKTRDFQEPLLLVLNTLI